MSDIVGQLRTIPRSGAPIGLTWNLCDDAADEIEKLRAALREIKRRTQDAHPMSYVADYWRIANEALGEKE
jgi:hypothetical protein